MRLWANKSTPGEKVNSIKQMSFGSTSIDKGLSLTSICSSQVSQSLKVNNDVSLDYLKYGGLVVIATLFISHTNRNTNIELRNAFTLVGLSLFQFESDFVALKIVGVRYGYSGKPIVMEPSR